jgi:hypothetical protein
MKPLRLITPAERAESGRKAVETARRGEFVSQDVPPDVVEAALESGQLAEREDVRDGMGPHLIADRFPALHAWLKQGVHQRHGHVVSSTINQDWTDDRPNDESHLGFKPVR